MIFQKQRLEARTVVAVDAVMRVGHFSSPVVLTNASSRGVMATLDYPPARGTKVELCIGNHVLQGQVRWTGSDCCGVAVRGSVSVLDLIEGGSVATTRIPENKAPRGPAAFLRAIVST